MSSIIDDMQSAAESIAVTAADAGYAFNFSPASLTEVERFIDENVTKGEPRPGGLLSKDLGKRVFALGAYVGEVIRRAAGGEWVPDDTPDAELTVALRTPDGRQLWPTQRVMKRIIAGNEESLVIYATKVGGVELPAAESTT